MDYIRMTPKIIFIFNLCEVTHGVCYQELIGNNLFVGVITDKGKAVDIQDSTPQTPP